MRWRGKGEILMRNQVTSEMVFKSNRLQKINILRTSLLYVIY